MHNRIHKKTGIGIDLIWLMVILAGFMFFTSLVPLPPNDFWWHLKIGEWIYLHHSIPSTNMYAWTLPADAPYYYGTWLGELLLYILYHWGGLELLSFIRTALAGLTLWMVGYESQRRTGSWRIAALVTALACWMILNNLPIRTQIWAWLPFVIYLILLSRYVDGSIHPTWLVLCPLIMSFWVNTHGSFILGLVLLGVYFVGEAVRTWIKMPGALNWMAIFRLGGIGLLTALATLVNPRFTGIFRYVWDLMTDQPSQHLIIEWQSPTPQGLANIGFYLSLLVLITILHYSRFRSTPTAILTIIGFLWLAWSGQRYIVWYAIVVMPILGQAISQLPINLPEFPSQRSWKNVVLVILLFLPALSVQLWFIDRMPLPETYWQQVLSQTPQRSLLSTETPVTATQYLLDHPGGHLFNEMGYGSYLIWAAPGQGVFIDPRVELYSYDQWQDYIDLTHGVRYQELFDRYHVDRVLLSKKLQGDLAATLASDPRWQREYQDPYAEIWIKSPLE